MSGVLKIHFDVLRLKWSPRWGYSRQSIVQRTTIYTVNDTCSVCWDTWSHICPHPPAGKPKHGPNKRKSAGTTTFPYARIRIGAPKKTVEVKE
ncbi:hypothetical protein ABEB36_008775 [Hypothenemus hampei]|uniref:Uncharacterized protein n=1 Tax=Hypothenemus hampei TaxID=57062 RepID=A0ABD1ENK8_HYPHA